MKICRLSNGEIKTTIKGFKGLKKVEKMANLDVDKNQKSSEEILECKEQINNLFMYFGEVIESGSEEVFKEISFETMKRNGLQVNVIEMKRRFKMTAYNQYKIDKMYKCYPSYYRVDEKTL